MQRRATTAVALALGCASAPSLAEAQPGRTGRTNVPGADTPRLLIAVCQSPDKVLGVQTADAIRGRMTSTSNPRQLFIVPKEQMVSFLESSGYKADSSLGLTDLKELAKGLRADEIVGCTMSRTATGAHHIEPRMMWAVDPSYGQPLPAIETNNLADAARQIERAVLEARKQFPDFKACQNHIRAGVLDKAIASAKLGITKYPNATIARNCLTNAFRENKQLDSAIKVTEDIRRIDAKNKWATQHAFLSYKDKADQEQDPAKQEQYREASVRALVELLGTDPGNPSLTSMVVNELGKIGKPSIALPIIDTLLVSNPGDPQLLRQKWFMSLAAARDADTTARSAAFAKALSAGEAMVKADSALADSVYYARQVIAAMAVSPQRGAEYASMAVRKYPSNQDYWWYKASSEWRAGQIQAAQQSTGRLIALNPKYPSATVMLGQLFLEQNMTDSAVALARRAVAAGEDSKTWGNFLLRPAQEALKKAQASEAEAKKDSLNKEKVSQAVADWEATVTISQEADKLSPSTTSKYFIGIASFYVGYAAVNGAQKAKSCPLAKRAQDMFLLTQLNMPAGGSIDPGTAQQLLGFVSQLAPAADQMAKLYCK